MTIGRRLMPLAVLGSVLAFVVAQASFALAPWWPQLWPAGLALAVLGGITPLIYAVNLRVLPVFSGRSWRSPRLLAVTIALSTGSWLVFLGRTIFSGWLETLGSALALAAGLLFLSSVLRMSRGSKPARPSATPGVNRAGDQVGQRLIRLAGLYLIFGLAVGLALCFWTPDSGRWQLVWAHSLLVGWFLNMAAGISYHVLPRWSHRGFSRPWLLTLHLWLVVVGLPLMVVALAFDLTGLFMVAGPLQALALLVFLWNILPAALTLPRLTRVGLLAAAAYLALGVSLGALMAAVPAQQPVLHHVHAEVNVFGWSCLLAASFGYYLFPRLAGQPIRWPRLATWQIGVQIAAVAVAAAGWWLPADAALARPLILAGGLAAAASLLGFGAIVGGVFLDSLRAPAKPVRQARGAQLPGGA